MTAPPRPGPNAVSAPPPAAEALAVLDRPADPAAILALAESEPGYDVEWWRDALRAGLFSGGLPGGSGGFAATVDHLRRLAGAAVPSPVHNGLVQSGALLAALGEREHLRMLLAGERRYAFCLTEPDGGSASGSGRTRAAPDGRIDGVKCYVPYAGDADVLLVVARTEHGPGVFAVDATTPGVTLEPIPTIGLDRQCAVHFDAAAATPLGGALSGEAAAALDAARARGVLALAADALGAAEAALRYTVERVTTRVQQGSPLGARQAVKHRCADMLLDVTLVRGVAERAARLVDERAPADDVRRAAAVA
ncbi:acyl-CoA dehydrogenase family protein, partial [Cryptosporangium minutisporangium]